MSIYHIYTKSLSRAGGIDKNIALRDGFSFAAFFLGPFWLFLYRSWLIGLLLITISFVLGYFLLPDYKSLFFGFIFATHLILGFEALWFQRRYLSGKNYRLSQVISAKNEEEMYLRFSAGSLSMQFFCPQLAWP